MSDEYRAGNQEEVRTLAAGVDVPLRWKDVLLLWRLAVVTEDRTEREQEALESVASLLDDHRARGLGYDNEFAEGQPVQTHLEAVRTDRAAYAASDVWADEGPTWLTGDV